MNHKTFDGREIPIKKLSNGHLKNIIAFLERKAKEGVCVRYGAGSSAEDMWMEEEVLKGEPALRYLNYYLYKAEWNLRERIYLRTSNELNKII